MSREWRITFWILIICYGLSLLSHKLAIDKHEKRIEKLERKDAR